MKHSFRQNPSDKRSRTARVRRTDWSRNPHAVQLADKRWWVTLDPDLVDLLTGEGDAASRLRAFGRVSSPAAKKRSRQVCTIPLSDDEYRRLKAILTRIGATVRYVPPHPNTRFATSPSRSRRKAG